MQQNDDQQLNDPELATIATELQETAQRYALGQYAINPAFKEELRKKILAQFAENEERTRFAI